jgi:hypothetical protein
MRLRIAAFWHWFHAANGGFLFRRPAPYGGFAWFLGVKQTGFWYSETNL